MSLRHFRINKPIHSKKEKEISLRKYLEDTLTGAQPFRDAHKLSLEELKKNLQLMLKLLINLKQEHHNTLKQWKE